MYDLYTLENGNPKYSNLSSHFGQQSLCFRTMNILRVKKNYYMLTILLKSTPAIFLVTPQMWHVPTSRGHIFVQYFGLYSVGRICGQRKQLLACPFFFSHAGVDYLFMLYTIIIIIHRHATAGWGVYYILFLDLQTSQSLLKYAYCVMRAICRK